MMIANFFTGPFPLLQLTFKVTLLLGLFLLIWFCASDRSASFRHRILVVALISLPLLGMASILIPSHELPLLQPNAIARFEDALMHPGDAESKSLQLRAPQETTGAASVKLESGLANGNRRTNDNRSFNAETHSVEPDRFEPALQEHPSGSFQFSVRSIVFTAWATGCVLLILRFAAAWIIVRATVNRSQQVPTDGLSVGISELIESCQRNGIAFREHQSEGQMPMCFGIFHSTIMLPKEFSFWNPEDQESVILHESAHAMRRDCMVNFAAHIQRAILWFHPFSWMLLRFLKSESEMACDDWAIARGINNVNYASALFEVTMATRRKPTVATVSVSMADCSPLERRMQSILSPTAERRPISVAWQFAIATISIAAISALSSFHLGATTLAQNVVTGSETKIEHRIEIDGSVIVRGTLLGAVELETPFGYAKFDFDKIRSLKPTQNGRHEVLAEDGSVLTGIISQAFVRYLKDGDYKNIDVSKIRKVTTIGNANLIAGELTSGFLHDNITYHIRAPRNYEPSEAYPAIVFFHDGDGNSRTLIEQFVNRSPGMADQMLLVGINGENESRKKEGSFNYTYIDFAGKSDKYSGFPGTDRQSPALVTEALASLKDRVPISKVFVIGQGDGAYLALSVHMNYPELVDGTVAINGGLLIQCVPDAYTNESLIKVQKQTPLWIMFHSSRLAGYSNSLTSAAHSSFKHADFPNLKLSTKKSLDELPIERAISWFAQQSKQPPNEGHIRAMKSSQSGF